MSDLKDKDEPLSTSSVSLQLSLIQKRCSELLDDDQLGLALDDTPRGDTQEDSFNPYDRG